MRDELKNSVTGTGVFITSELRVLETGMNQFASRINLGQEDLKANLLAAQNSTCQQISKTGKDNIRALDTAQIENRRARIIQQRNQQRIYRELCKLNRGRDQLSSMLSKLSKIQLESESADSDSNVAQYLGLEAMAFPLLQMRASLDEVIQELRSGRSPKVSQEEVDFLFDEYEQLVAFCQETCAFRAQPSPPTAEDDSKDRLSLRRSVLGSRNYSLEEDHQPSPKAMRRMYVCRKSQESTVGRLEVQFEKSIGDYNGRPTTLQRASFYFFPKRAESSIAIYASFCKEVQMACKPCIFRTLREVRIIQWTDEIYEQLVLALKLDDLTAVKRMLSFGHLRPWDQILSEDKGNSRNLIEVQGHLLSFSWVDD